MSFHDSRYFAQAVYRKYVDVLEIRRKDGSIEPVEILFGGRRFKIDKYEYKQYDYSRAGSGGKHYTVWIKGKIREMYLEKDKWFIETEKAPKKQTLDDINFDDIHI